MSRPDLLRLAREERADILALLQELTPEQWAARSLCSEWTVRDVAVHIVSYDELSILGLVGTFLLGGPSINKVNEVALRKYSHLEAPGVIALVARAQQPRGLTAGFGGGIALTDGTIHHQDIRRALGIPRTIPPARLTPALDFALGAPTLPAKKNAKGLRLVALDLDWTHGSGQTVEGPAEALIMALAGRSDALDDLAGDGLPTLRRRVAGV